MCPGDESADISAPELEFRSTANDAWYIVQVVLQSETFVVKFSEFPKSIDKRVSAADFQTLQAVHDFVRRFRPFSVQLQDNQCSKIVKGLTVSAPFKFKRHDIRFYDAVVESVHHEEHSFAKKKWTCMCTFVLRWVHGPNMGHLSTVYIDSIWLIQSAAQLDFRVASFAKMAKEKLEIVSDKCGAISGGNSSLGNETRDGICVEENCSSSLLESSLFRLGLQETERSRQFGSNCDGLFPETDVPLTVGQANQYMRLLQGQFRELHAKLDRIEARLHQSENDGDEDWSLVA